MTVEPEQVEAHAARGYSLTDVARLLGAPFISDKTDEGRESVEAFNRGAARWRDNGSPMPPRAADVIAQAVHSQLLSREMTRPELKDALGFRYDDLNLAIETLERQFLIDHAENVRGTTCYRAAGMKSAVAETPSVVHVPVPAGYEVFQKGSNGHAVKAPSTSPCVDCGEPKSIGAGERCRPCYEAKAAKNQEEKISARAPGKPDPRQGVTYKELDLQQVEDLMATSETMADAAKKLGMTTSQLSVRRQKDDAVAAAVDRGRKRFYESDRERVDDEDGGFSGEPDHCTVCRDNPAVFEKRCPDCMTKNQQIRLGKLASEGSQKSEENITQSITTKPPCGCGRDGNHVGRCAYRREKAEKMRANLQTAQNHPSEQSIARSSVSPETAKPAMAQVQVMGGVKMHNEVEVRVSEMAHWPAERITEFFEALAKVIEIPQRPAKPRVIKRAWSVDFESDDNGEGVMGMSRLYLVSMLHPGMEPVEKDAVWTLIQYLAKVEAAVEAEKLTEGTK